MGDLAALADGEELPVDAGGRGGGNITLVSDLITAALNIAGLYALLRGGVAILYQAINRPKRDESRAWLTADGGSGSEPSPELLAMVRRYPEYGLSEVERAYNLSTEQAARLLRATGFEKVPDGPHTYPDSWRRLAQKEAPGPVDIDED